MSQVETIKHTLASGIQLEIKITSSGEPEPEPTPDPELDTMLVGMTPDPTEYDKWLTAFPLSGITRIFSKTDPPKWNDTRVEALRAKGMIPFVSWKTYDLSSVSAWLDAKPDDRPVAATWMHEPEPKDYRPELFKQRFTATYELVKAHPKGNQVLFGPVLTRQWTENTAGRGYATYDPGVGDFLGCDMYANSWQDAYPNPGDFVRYFGRYYQDNTHERELWVPELGAVKMPSDTTGARRAEWLTQILAELYEWDCKVAIWWNDKGTPGANGEERDFSLSDEPSLSAFKQALEHYNNV